MTETVAYLSPPALGTPVPASVRSAQLFRQARRHRGPDGRNHAGIALRSTQ